LLENFTTCTDKMVCCLSSNSSVKGVVGLDILKLRGTDDDNVRRPPNVG